MRIGIYARVSKSDASQNPENQLEPLRKMANALQGEIVEEYVDLASGANSGRVNFSRMFSDAEKRNFGLLLIWSLDRFSREGISNTLGYLERLKRSGVAIKSMQESWLDTRDKGFSELLLAIFSWVAAQERQRISERVKAGLERIKREGKRLGRPKGSKDKRKRSVSGYHQRYAGQSKKDRQLGPRS